MLHVSDSYDSLSQSGVVVFCCIIGGLIEVLEKAGGAAGVANHLFVLAKKAQDAAIVSVVLSFAYFFDDFAGTFISFILVNLQSSIKNEC